jgi:hypothetical protein
VEIKDNIPEEPASGRRKINQIYQLRAFRYPHVPLLQQRGLQLIERPADNFEQAPYKGLLLKDSYWRWPERNLAGNAIDFFVKVLGLSFNDAMR